MCSKCVDITFNWKLRDLHLTGDNMLHVILQTMSITSKKFRFCYRILYGWLCPFFICLTNVSVNQKIKQRRRNFNKTEMMMVKMRRMWQTHTN